MSDQKTDNELLEEILFHTKETRRATVKIQGNTLFIVIIVIAGIVFSVAATLNIVG